MAVAASTLDQLAATPGADAIADLVVLAADALVNLVQMFFAGVLSLDGGSVENGCEALHLGDCHDGSAVTIYLVEQLAGIDDRSARVAAQIGTVQEDDNRNEIIDGLAEQTGQRFDVRVVLL